MNKYRNVVFILIFLGMVSLLIGITYSFFNYTRTGSPNTLQVGRIFFETTEGPEINLTNVFPIDSLNVNNDTDNVGSVTINIKGDTDYEKGIEYLVTAVDVNNNAGTGVNTRRLPISVDVTYTNNGNGTTIGTSNDNYFNEGVRGGNTSYYKELASSTIIHENDPLLVGYIAPGETGIDGNITIKAFIDRDRVAISDTYATEPHYLLNPNMTPELVNSCISYFTNIGIASALYEGESMTSFCEGTGTAAGLNIIDGVNYNLPPQFINDLINLNVIIENENEYTPDEWAENRIIVSTSDWNAFNQNGLSFKVKVEANEGLWVEEPGKIENCPNCKFMYSESLVMYKTVNTLNKTPTVITDTLTDNYLDIVNGQGKMMFLGLVLNDSNQITNAYACGMKDGTPFCVEGTPDNTRFTEKQNYLNSSTLWNNSCTNATSGSNSIYFCMSSNANSVTAQLHDHGCAVVMYRLENNKPLTCVAEENGRIRCSLPN